MRNFEWDAAGQLLSDGDKQHQYNPQGRKASSQAPEPSGTGSQTLNSHYLYNGHSQRVRKASPLGHTDYSYGPAELGMSHWPLGIYRSSGSTQASTEILYLPTPQGPLPAAAEIDGQLYAIEADHLHTPWHLSNAQGQGVWQWITSDFGEVPASHAGNGFVLEGEGQGADPGQVHDTETGLHYDHHRYYDPYLTVGYAEADPLGLEAGWNRFSYVDGDPLGAVDPQGLTATFPHPAVLIPTFIVGLCAANDSCRTGASAIIGAMGSTIGDFTVQMASHGNVVDTKISQDYEEYASNERLCRREPIDKCTWLSLNAHNYPPAAVKATEKAWGCRGSRHGKGGRGR